MNSSSYTPPEGADVIRTIDVHAAGEPLRVIVEGLPPVPGDSMLEKRRYAQEHLDALRRRLMWEPRGHADMYGAIVTDPVTRGQRLRRAVPAQRGLQHHVRARHHRPHQGPAWRPAWSPPARARRHPHRHPRGARGGARARTTDGRVRRVAFENVPSFVYRRGIEVRLAGHRRDRLRHRLRRRLLRVLRGRRPRPVAGAVAARPPDRGGQAGEARRPRRRRRSTTLWRPISGFLYGVIFTGPPRGAAHHSRHVCIFAEGEVDRSPTGTGVSGRAALLHDAGAAAGRRDDRHREHPRHVLRRDRRRPRRRSATIRR